MSALIATAVAHPPISYDLAGAAAATGLGTKTLTRAIGAGHLRAKKSDVDADGQPIGKWVITHAALVEFIDGLVDA